MLSAASEGFARFRQSSPSAQIRFPGHFLGSLRPNFTGKWIGSRENLRLKPHMKHRKGMERPWFFPYFPKETNPFGRNVIAQACRSKTWMPLYGHHPIQAAPGQGSNQ